MGRGSRSRAAGRRNTALPDRNKTLRLAAHDGDDDLTPRGARILRAALEELARSDYGGLSFERVAARAGVNKTTVYRNWETKADLVRAALTLVARTAAPAVSTGSLRDDLIQLGRQVVEFSSTFEGQSIVRMSMMQDLEPELASIANDLRVQQLAQLSAMGEAARARGELPEGVDFELLLDCLCGAMIVRLFQKNERVGDVQIAQIVDLLLKGAGVPPRGAPGRAAKPDEARSKRS